MRTQNTQQTESNKIFLAANSNYKIVAGSHWITTVDFDHSAYGFIYRIINNENGMQYLGSKTLSTVWKSYTGSSKFLTPDIRNNRENFTFIIESMESKDSLLEAEKTIHLKENVVKARDHKGFKTYYNRCIATGGKKSTNTAKPFMAVDLNDLSKEHELFITITEISNKYPQTFNNGVSTAILNRKRCTNFFFYRLETGMTITQEELVVMSEKYKRLQERKALKQTNGSITR